MSKEEIELRDYFAAKAMNSIVCLLNNEMDTIFYDKIAIDSYKISDAMLKARKQ